MLRVSAKFVIAELFLEQQLRQSSWLEYQLADNPIPTTTTTPAKGKKSSSVKDDYSSCKLSLRFRIAFDIASLANDLESHLCFDDDVAKTNYHQASLFRFEFLPWPVWKSAAKQSNSLRSTGQAGWLAGEMINAEQAEMVICINLDLRSGQYGSPSHFSLAGVWMKKPFQHVYCCGRGCRRAINHLSYSTQDNISISKVAFF